MNSSGKWARRNSERGILDLMYFLWSMLVDISEGIDDRTKTCPKWWRISKCLILSIKDR